MLPPCLHAIPLPSLYSLSLWQVTFYLPLVWMPQSGLLLWGRFWRVLFLIHLSGPTSFFMASLLAEALFILLYSSILFHTHPCPAGAQKVVTSVHKYHQSVLVHCSDGWDRTPQVQQQGKLNSLTTPNTI